MGYRCEKYFKTIHYRRRITMTKIRMIFVLLPLLIVLCLGLIVTETTLAEPPTKKTHKLIPPKKTHALIPPSWSQIIPADDRFQLVLNDEAVLDRETGLVWEKSPDTSDKHWFEAVAWCNQKLLGGRMGWRLPALEELASLADPGVEVHFLEPCLPTGHPFLGVTGFALYWSSTTYILDPTWACTVMYYTDPIQAVTCWDKTLTKDPLTGDRPFRAWCVRGGQGHYAH